MRKLDSLNRQLEQLITQAGGHELNPDELKLLDVQHDILELDAKIKEAQENWLKLQNSVVSLSEKRVQQLNDINYSRKSKVFLGFINLKYNYLYFFKQNCCWSSKRLSKSKHASRKS